MGRDDDILNKIAEALLIDYSSVYYVDAATNEYVCYSVDPTLHSFHLERQGRDFFQSMAQDAERVVYEEDRHLFTDALSREKLLSDMKQGAMHSVMYRLMIDGKPVYHALRMIRGVGGGSDCFVLGVLNVDDEIRHRREAEKIEREREVFIQIAASLAEHYDTIYYIDIETGHYIEFSSTDTYKSLCVPAEGDDFFAESEKNIRRVVHPDDQEMVLRLHRKNELLRTLAQKRSNTASYRLLINGAVMHARLSQMLSNDRRHIIVCIENINAEVALEESLKRAMAINVTYSQIAEGLADHYDALYYVNLKTDQYVEFSSTRLLDTLDGSAHGVDFFGQAKKDTLKVVYPADWELVSNFFDRESLLQSLQQVSLRQLEYRLLSAGNPVYVRLSVMFTKDRSHLLLCVENIDEQVRREAQHNRALRQANARARQDELTGAKNKNAYQEYEASVQKELAAGAAPPFAIVVCDLNDLKRINDTLGHKAGDEQIKAACRLICDVFTHSPVFRVGGDEFVAFLKKRDFNDRDRLLAALREHAVRNRDEKHGPVIASGMAVYEPGTDARVADVFERADAAMYENKKLLKGEAAQEPRD